jgi:hypothetical protein
MRSGHIHVSTPRVGRNVGDAGRAVTWVLGVAWVVLLDVARGGGGGG